MEKCGKIIVLTPVKNEDWILDRFLSATSTFADLIIILDQNSSDNSRAICKKFGNVVLLNNESDVYDEASRQITLIRKARELVPDHKRILLALDTDEILAADYYEKPAWRQMVNADAGTILLFNKVDIFETSYQYIDYKTPWPLGFVDDGSEHKPKIVHSIRIPTPADAPKLIMDDVNIMHYAMVDMERQDAKMRMYSVVEKSNRTSNFFNRRTAYKANKDWTANLQVREVPASWIEGWEKQGINLSHFESRPFYWQDSKVLEYFRKYGEHKFYSEDIWDVDWNEISLKAGFKKRISPPSRFVREYYNSCFRFNKVIRQIFKNIKSIQP